MIHGLSDGVDVTTWMRTVKSKLLEVDRDSNVVLVDWSRGAAVNLLNDLRFASVRIVGQQTVQLIKGLEALYPQSFSPENVHIIAHSFGTFAAGESHDFSHVLLSQLLINFVQICIPMRSIPIYLRLLNSSWVISTTPLPLLMLLIFVPHFLGKKKIPMDDKHLSHIFFSHDSHAPCSSI